MVRETFHHDTRQTARNLAKFLRIGTLSWSQVCPLPLVYIICLPLMKEGVHKQEAGVKVHCYSLQMADKELLE